MTGKFEHVTPILINLHWLPPRQRTEYKFLLLIFKCLHGSAPSYLSDLLVRRPDWGSRRDSLNLLKVPKFKRKTFGGISFSVAGPELWNSLPVEIRTCESLDDFKILVKTQVGIM